MKKYSILIAILLVLLAGAAIYYIHTTRPKNITVSLDKEFRLYEGQTAQIKNTSDVLAITRFINSPCAKGHQCFWSGQAVQYAMTINGRVYRSNYYGNQISLQGTPYYVYVKKSNYKTFADFLVSKTSPIH